MIEIKNPRPKDVALICPLEWGFIRFFAFRKFFGVLEYWSDGVVEKFDYSILSQKQNLEKL